MKKWMMLMLAVCMLCMAICAAAESAVLTVDLPDDALLTENVEFEDGDRIQTYQLDNGVRVQFLRYAAFDMTLEELAEGEWIGYTASEAMAIEEIGGYPAQGLCLNFGEGEEQVNVYTIMTDVQGAKLIFQAVFPASLGEKQIEESMDAWVESMEIQSEAGTDVG